MNCCTFEKTFFYRLNTAFNTFWCSVRYSNREVLSLYTIPQKSLKNLQENLISVYEIYIYESSVRSTLDKNQININTSTCIVIWFSGIYFLQVY